MKVQDTAIGCIIETDNEFVIEQFKKYPARYKEIKKVETKKQSGKKSEKD